MNENKTINKKNSNIAETTEHKHKKGADQFILLL